MRYNIIILLLKCLVVFAIANTHLLAQNPPSSTTKSDATVTKQKTEELALQIYVLTMEPGEGIERLWSWWGHTGLLIRDRKNGKDIVFDYGRFGAQSLSFVIKHIQGEPVFLLGVESLQSTIYKYNLQNRKIMMQELLFDPIKLEELYKKLIVNAQPQNRYYMYKHLSNNCTTKVRDLIDEALEGEFRKKLDRMQSERTVSSKALAPLAKLPPLFFLATHLSGYTIANHRNVWDDMFMPDDLMLALESYRKGTPANAKPLVGPIKTLLGNRIPREESNLVLPWLIFCFFIMLYIFALYVWPLVFPKQYVSQYTLRIGWWFWYLGAGLLGILSLYVYVFEGSMSYNYREVGYKTVLHGFQPMFLLFPLGWFLLKRDAVVNLNRRQIWYWMHRIALLIAEVGLGLAVFIDHYAIPSLLLSVLVQRILLWQVKEGRL